MSPEYGATCGFFPVDELTLEYLRLTGRPDERVALVEAYCKENLLWHDPADAAAYSQVVELDLGDGRAVARRPAPPAGPRAAQRARRTSFLEALGTFGVDYDERRTTRRSPRRSRRATRRPSRRRPAAEPRARAGRRSRPRRRPRAASVSLDGEDFELEHGAVVIAAITSCTNTSNPQVMVGAGLLAKKAVELGLRRKPVGEVVARARLARRHRLLRARRPAALPRRARLQHRRLRLHDLHRQLRAAARRDLGRGHRGRPRRLRRALGQPQLRGAHPSRGEGELPRLAAARRRLRARRPDGHRPRRPSRSARARDGSDVFLRDVWPTSAEIEADDRVLGRAARCSATHYADVFAGDDAWRALPMPEGDLYAWDRDSTYVRRPPYFDGHAAASRTPSPTSQARAASSCSATRSRPTTSRPPARSARLARRAVPDRARRRAQATSTRTARGAATTR